MTADDAMTPDPVRTDEPAPDPQLFTLDDPVRGRLGVAPDDPRPNKNGSLLDPDDPILAGIDALVLG